MPSFIPRHYDIHAWTLAEARRYLDAKHQLGWRVAMMAPKPEPAKSSSFSRRFPLKKALRFQLTHELGDNREEGSSLNPKPQPRLGLFSFSQLERAKLHLKSTCNCMRNSPSLRLKFCPKNFSRLTRLQYEALQKSSYIHMPKQEADSYDERRCRIAGICGMLRPHR